MYTKGEWKVIANPLGRFTDIFGGVGMPIATITHYSRNREHDKANAQLMAAAPNTAEALQELITFLIQKQYVFKEELTAPIQKGINALKKAGLDI